LRWRLLLNTNNGPDYLRQLRGLGAILAVPVREKPDVEYQVVRDLRRPARLLAEDVNKIQRIHWVDDNPESVRDLLATLGLNVRASHFKAFFPEELERQLFELEKKAAGGRAEDEIYETRFRLREVGSRFVPEVDSVTFTTD
jgi:hypothetical protein